MAILKALIMALYKGTFSYETALRKVPKNAFWLDNCQINRNETERFIDTRIKQKFLGLFEKEPQNKFPIV